MKRQKNVLDEFKDLIETLSMVDAEEFRCFSVYSKKGILQLYTDMNVTKLYADFLGVPPEDIGLA